MLPGFFSFRRAPKRKKCHFLIILDLLLLTSDKYESYLPQNFLYLSDNISIAYFSEFPAFSYTNGAVTSLHKSKSGPTGQSLSGRQTANFLQLHRLAQFHQQWRRSHLLLQRSFDNRRSLGTAPIEQTAVEAVEMALWLQWSRVDPE